jgi:hypothetical protein
MDLFGTVWFHTGGWVTVGPPQGHRVTYQCPDALQQNDPGARFARYLPDDDIDVLAGHLVDLTVTMML